MNYNNNDWLSASRANSFSHNDPNRSMGNSASGFPMSGNGSAKNWLNATKANNFSGMGSLSKVCSCGGGRKSAYTLTGTQPEVIEISGNKSVPVLTTQFKPEGADIHGAGGGTIKTPFYGTRFYTSNYNMPTLSGTPLFYSSTTLGQLPDLGLNVQPPRQAYWFTGL